MLRMGERRVFDITSTTVVVLKNGEEVVFDPSLLIRPGDSATARREM